MTKNLLKNFITAVSITASVIAPNQASAEIYGTFNESQISKLKNIKNNDNKYKKTKAFLNQSNNTIFLLTENDIFDMDITQIFVNHPYIIENQELLQECKKQGYIMVFINKEGFELFDELLKSEPNGNIIKKLSSVTKTRIINSNGSKDNNINVSLETEKLADLIINNNIDSKDEVKALDQIISRILGDEPSQEKIDKLITEVKNENPINLFAKYGILAGILIGLFTYIITKNKKKDLGKYNKILDNSDTTKEEVGLYNKYINDNLLTDQNIKSLLRSNLLNKFSEIIFGNESQLKGKIDNNRIIHIIKNILDKGKKEDKIIILSILNQVFLNTSPMGEEISYELYKTIAKFFIDNEKEIKYGLDNIKKESELKIDGDDELLKEAFYSLSLSIDKKENFILNYINILTSLGAKYMYNNLLSYGKADTNKALGKYSNNEIIKSKIETVKNLFEMAKKDLVMKNDLHFQNDNSRQESIILKKITEDYVNFYFQFIIKNYENTLTDLPKYKL